jgi:hypothetical protein
MAEGWNKKTLFESYILNKLEEADFALVQAEKYGCYNTADRSILWEVH